MRTAGQRNHANYSDERCDQRNDQDGGAGDVCAAANCVTFSGSVGNYSINMSTGIKQPFNPFLDLNSVNLAVTSGAGLLTIATSANNYTVGAPQFALQVGGTSSLGGVTTFSAYGGNSNTFFDTSHQIGSTLTFGAGVSPYRVRRRAGQHRARHVSRCGAPVHGGDARRDRPDHRHARLGHAVAGGGRCEQCQVLQRVLAEFSVAHVAVRDNEVAVAGLKARAAWAKDLARQRALLAYKSSGAGLAAIVDGNSTFDAANVGPPSIG